MINRPSKIMLAITLALAILSVSSCATLTDDIETETHANPTVNYKAYKTYAWAGNEQIVFDPVGQWEQPTLDTDEQVKFIINRELQARGINQVESHPDLLITFIAGVDATTLELKEKPNSDKTILVNAPKEALVIAFIDAETGYAVWLGYAMGEAQEQQSIDNIHTRIDYAVKEIFSDY